MSDKLGSCSSSLQTPARVGTSSGATRGAEQLRGAHGEEESALPRAAAAVWHIRDSFLLAFLLAPALASPPGPLASFWLARRCWCCGLGAQFPASFSRGATFPLFHLCPGGCSLLDAAEAGATAALPLPRARFRHPVSPEGPGQTNVAFAAFPSLSASPCCPSVCEVLLLRGCGVLPQRGTRTPSLWEPLPAGRGTPQVS